MTGEGDDKIERLNYEVRKKWIKVNGRARPCACVCRCDKCVSRCKGEISNARAGISLPRPRPRRYGDLKMKQ